MRRAVLVVFLVAAGFTLSGYPQSFQIDHTLAEKDTETSEIYDGFRIRFPAGPDEVHSLASEEMSVHQSTAENISFSVVVKEVKNLALPRFMDNAYDEVTAAVCDPATTDLVSQRSVHAYGVRGREVVFERDGTRSYGRIFLHGDRLYIIMANMKTSTDPSRAVAIIDEFLDSFVIEEVDVLKA